MPLITEKKASLAGGVNQQASEHRLSSQVEEMIDCVPTLDRGLMKRSPTENLPLKFLDDSVATLDFTNDMWSYEFDKGSGLEESDEFSYTINENGLQILNTTSGILYENGNGINYEGAANTYLNGVFAGRNGYSATTIKDTVFLVNKTIEPLMLTTIEVPDFDIKGYIWVKRSDPIDGYKHGADIYLKLNGVDQPVISVPLGTAKVSSDAAATDLATRITAASVNLTATASGSVVEIIVSGAGYTMEAVNASDSFGDSASFGWGYKVEALSDLPKNMGTFAPLVRIGKNARESFWMLYSGGQWKEHYEVGINTGVDPDTMPHIVVPELNIGTGFVEFYVRTYQVDGVNKWDDRDKGDNTTNKPPLFLDPDKLSPIKDIFFFRNRMGLITSGGTSLSEVGEYGNFFRTSVATLLDGDRVDSAVESRAAINIEHALVFDDSVLFFSNKSQFRFEGGDILSPKSFKITEITSYEIDQRIKPLAMNNHVYFVSKRGDKSAVFEMRISNNSTRSSEADDITAHCQSYIDGDLDRMTSSPVNNMLFLTSRDNTDTVFVYKYYDSGNTRHQSAWFKWSFNGEVFVGFTIGKKFHIMINRKEVIAGSDWVMGTGEWRMAKPWLMTSSWIMSPDDITDLPQFEKLNIFPQDQNLVFLDNDDTIINSFVNFGEWVAGQDGNKEIRGSLKFRTIEFSSEDGSEFGLWVRDKNRDTIRTVAHKYIDGRKPSVYGDSKNIETGIVGQDDKGFRLTAVSFEGTLNRRAKTK